MKIKHVNLNILFLLSIFLTVSCVNNKEDLSLKIIPLENTVEKFNILNLSNYTAEIKYIPLETNDSVLIGRILQISYENGKFLIRSTSSFMSECFLFDIKGNFCSKIGNHGQGPDDYLGLIHSFILGNHIYLIDVYGNNLFIYDTNGFLVENNNLRRIYENTDKKREYDLVLQIFPLKKDTFVMNVGSSYGYYPKAILFETYQSNTKIIKEYPNHEIIDKKKSPGGSPNEFGIMYRFKDDVRTYRAINDTIFTIAQNLEMKEAFVFESGKFRLPLSIVERRETTSYKNYIIPRNIFESFDHLFIEFNFGNHAPEPFEYTSLTGRQAINSDVYGVFDKNSGELTLMKQPTKGKLGFKNDVDNGPIIWPHYISSNNELVSYISPEEFMDYYEKTENPTPRMTEIAKNLKIDDNPIVIIAKLKEKDNGAK